MSMERQQTEEYNCEKCGQNFSSDGELARHYDMVHPSMNKDS
jgi:DNA-directed RNA polymerase subunit RPC12/RpoP